MMLEPREIRDTERPSKMGRVIPVAAVLVLAMALSLALALLAAGCAAAPSGTKQTITVTGEGKGFSRADEASVNVAVVQTGQTAQKALVRAGYRMGRVMGMLKQIGVPKKDMETAEVSVFPYTRVIVIDGRKQNARRYRSTNAIRVRTRKMNLLGKIIDTATKAGATTVSDVRFEATARNPARREALEKAMADAKARADVLAKAAGVSVSRVVTVKEADFGIDADEVDFSSDPRYRYAGARSGALLPAPIVTPRAVFTAQVSVVYGF